MSTTYLETTKEETVIIKNNAHIGLTKNKRIDYMRTICKKPWGHEFLVYESKQIAIWFLKIDAGHTTSLHTHFHKDTFIIALSGCAKLSTPEKTIILNPMDSVHIPRHKFHGVGSFSSCCYLLEIEIFQDDLDFSDKNDLLRINDLYHRSSTGYEASIIAETSPESLAAHNYYELVNGLNNYVGNTNICVGNIYNQSAKYNVLLSGDAFQEGVYCMPGSCLRSGVKLSDDALVLSIVNNCFMEDAKIIHCFDQLKIIISEIRGKKEKIVLTSGCYDIVHVGHLNTLRQAKSLGGKLFVCLSSDSQIAKLKGDGRPINKFQDRLDLFKTITYVDYIIIYDEAHIQNEETLGEIMKIVDPDHWVKGSDYTKSAILEKHPYLRDIVLFDNVKDKSTTQIVKNILLLNT
jgi:rfaE bifunctional protein nucleotidyltransferase chain/domain